MNRQSWQLVIARPGLWIILARTSLIIMELTLYSLWYQGLFSTVQLPLPALFGLLAAVMVTSYGLARVLEAKETRLLVRQALFLTWLGLVIVGTLKLMIFKGIDIGLGEMINQPIQYISLEGSEGASFFHVLVILLLVWRGVRLAGSQISLWRLQVVFQIGLIFLLFYGIALAADHPTEAITGMFVYLFFALVGLSATRIFTLSEMQEGRVPHFSAGWLAGILFTGLVVVVLALLTGWAASGQIIDWIIRFFVLILTVLTTLLMWLLTPVITVLARAVAGIIDFLQKLFNNTSAIRLPKFFEDLVIEFARIVQQALPGVIAGRGIVMVIIIFLVLLAILMGLRSRHQQLRLREEEDYEIEASAEGNLWQKLARRLLPDPAALRLHSPGQLFAAVRIRQIYRRLMALGQKHGAGRQSSQTPFEFLPQLEALFPGEQEHLGLITDAYIKVRYGEYPETLREVEEVQKAWDSIRKQARQISKNKHS